MVLVSTIVPSSLGGITLLAITLICICLYQKRKHHPEELEMSSDKENQSLKDVEPVYANIPPIVDESSSNDCTTEKSRNVAYECHYYIT